MYMYTLWGRKSTRLVMLIKLESASDPDQDTLWGRKHCLRIYFVGSETLYIIYGAGNLSFTALQTSDLNHNTLCKGINKIKAIILSNKNTS